jgi:hypothetical protein
VPIRHASLLVSLVVLVAASAIAQPKPRIGKAADLPRFSYPIEGSVEQVIRDDAKFGRFAGAVRHDAESILKGYEIDDRATLRSSKASLPS